MIPGRFLVNDLRSPSPQIFASPKIGPKWIQNCISCISINNINVLSI